MNDFGCEQFVFSSSATVYGDSESLPISEVAPVTSTNPYGYSKLAVEDDWRVISLRYFNPVGAHASGLIGESPSDIPNNLMSYIFQVAVGRREYLQVFGNDYDTFDGTGVRDYIHVVDLAKGHVQALKFMRKENGFWAINLGTGKGYSVLEMVAAFERASGREVPYKIVERRKGDIAACYAAPSLAKEKLCWEAEFGLDKMCEDTWRWQSMNPSGYKA